MARPLKIECPGAVYHVTSRGNAREVIYKDDHDRQKFLEILSKAKKNTIHYVIPIALWVIIIYV